MQQQQEQQEQRRQRRQRRQPYRPGPHDIGALVCGLLAVLAGGCDEFATPAELAQPQILAIRAEPAAVAPGGTSALTILVADSDGPMADANLEVSWAVIPATPGQPPLGAIMNTGNGSALYTAPGDLTETTVAAVVATVLVASGEAGQPATELEALKVMIISDLPLANPTVTGFAVNDQDSLAENPIRMPRGQTVSLELATDPAPTDTSTFAWYSTVGEIERYQSNPTELLVNEQPGAGWLIVVTRDGRGGVAWHTHEVLVE